ncbi:hypothetical protein M569_09152, partial [Genlisea aurea]
SVPPSPPPPPQYSYPPITIILTVVLLACFFIGFFSIYFCRCFVQNIFYSWHHRHTPGGTPVGPANSDDGKPGLDPLIVHSFPSFVYSTVQEYRKEKYGLECAICLVEFDGSDFLRLLTICSHVFHQECIDLWLETHKSCPVCRRNLESATQSPSYNNTTDGMIGSSPLADSFSITIKDENQKKSSRVSISIGEQEREMEGGKFPRSHSTGHSIVRSRGEEEDRFTLRLPEHVKARILRGHNNSIKSCTTFGELKKKDNSRNSLLAEVADQ